MLKPDLTVWDDAHPAPTGSKIGDEHERSVCRWWTEDSKQQRVPLLSPKNAEQVKAAKGIIGAAIDTMIGRSLPLAADLDFELKTTFAAIGAEEFLILYQGDKGKAQEQWLNFLVK